MLETVGDKERRGKPKVMCNMHNQANHLTRTRLKMNKVHNEQSTEVLL